MDKIISQPTISVLMTVYNAENYIADAVNSILTQSFKDFEFIIIDDGSTDKSLSIFDKLNDSRIRLFCNAENKGLVYSLNRGLELANGEFIARMDADDISDIDRLAKQYAFMKENPNIGICGSWAKLIGHKKGYFKPVITAEEIKCALLFHCPIIHPSAFMRKSLLNKHNLKYNPEYFEGEEDYDLWQRCSLNFPLANLPFPLVKYRTKKNSLRQEQKSKRILYSLRNQIFLFNKYSIEISEDQLKLLNLTINTSLKSQSRQEALSTIKEFYNTLEVLLKINIKKKIFEEKAFEKVISISWRHVCVYNSFIGLSLYKYYNNSSIQKNNLSQKKEKFKFLIKCLLKI